MHQPIYPDHDALKLQGANSAARPASARDILGSALRLKHRLAEAATGRCFLRRVEIVLSDLPNAPRLSSQVS